MDARIKLFETFYICFYDIALWKYYKITLSTKLSAGYIKCIKLLFGFNKYSSMMIIELQHNTARCWSVLAKQTEVVNEESTAKCSKIHCCIGLPFYCEIVRLLLCFY